MSYKECEIVQVPWPMINDPTKTKMRPAVITHINDQKIALLFSISSEPMTPSSLPVVANKNSWVNPDRFQLVHVVALKPINKKMIGRDVLDKCLSTCKFNFHEMLSLEMSYSSLGIL